MKRALSVLPAMLLLYLAAGVSMADDQPLQMTGEDNELGEEYVLDALVAPHCRDAHPNIGVNFCVCWHHGYFVSEVGTRIDQPKCQDLIEANQGRSESLASGVEEMSALGGSILTPNEQTTPACVAADGKYSEGFKHANGQTCVCGHANCWWE